MVAAWIALAFLLSPPGPGAGAYRIAPQKVYFQAADSDALSFRFQIDAATPTLAGQFNQARGGKRHFHVRFQRETYAGQPLAVFLPSIGGETLILINGALIAQSRATPLFAPGWGRSSAYVAIPEHVLVPGQNRLDFIVEDDPAWSGVREVYIGPSSVMSKAADHQAAWMRWTPLAVAIAAGAGIVFCVAGVIFGRRKIDYVLMGIASCLVACAAALSLLPGELAPLAVSAWARIGLPAFIGALIAALWALRLKPGLPPGSLAAGAQSGVYLLAFAGPLLGLCYMVLPVCFGHPGLIASWFLVAPAALLMTRSVRDCAADIMMRQEMVQELTQKVHEQAEELDEKSRRIAMEMRNRAVLEERQRFTRDIHDGIGGQLLSLLLRIRSGTLANDKIAEELQAGLNDLRLVVDSIDHVADDLASALRTFRVRAEPQMKAAGIPMVWQQSDTFSGTLPAKGAILHLYRFMQEALTNVVRHAGATHVGISVTQPDMAGPLIIKISDDGGGIDPGKMDEGGKGLRNLQRRAEALGGSLHFGPGLMARGASVTLIVPMQA